MYFDVATPRSGVSQIPTDRTLGWFDQPDAMPREFQNSPCMDKKLAKAEDDLPSVLRDPAPVRATPKPPTTEQLDVPPAPLVLPKRPAVPRLNLGRVERVVERGPALPAPLSPCSSDESDCSEQDSPPLTPDGPPKGADLYDIFSESSSVGPSEVTPAAVQFAEPLHPLVEQKVGEPEPVTPELADWTYERYVKESKRRTMLEATRCGPLRDSQRRLLLAGLILIQVAMLIFALDWSEGGGLGSSRFLGSSRNALVARELRLLLAIFAGVAGLVTLCYCLSLGRSIAESPHEFTDLEEARELSPERTDKPARPYKELLRMMKEEAREAHLARAAGNEKLRQSGLHEVSTRPYAHEGLPTDDPAAAALPARPPGRAKVRRPPRRRAPAGAVAEPPV